MRNEHERRCGTNTEPSFPRTGHSAIAVTPRACPFNMSAHVGCLVETPSGPSSEADTEEGSASDARQLQTRIVPSSPPVAIRSPSPADSRRGAASTHRAAPKSRIASDARARAFPVSAGVPPATSSRADQTRTTPSPAPVTRNAPSGLKARLNTLSLPCGFVDADVSASAVHARTVAAPSYEPVASAAAAGSAVRAIATARTPEPPWAPTDATGVAAKGARAASDPSLGGVSPPKRPSRRAKPHTRVTPSNPAVANAGRSESRLEDDAGADRPGTGFARIGPAAGQNPEATLFTDAACAFSTVAAMSHRDHRGLMPRERRGLRRSRPIASGHTSFSA